MIYVRAGSLFDLLNPCLDTAACVEGWNWCLVPDGGYDAVFFAGLAIVAMCVASPRWDALIVLALGKRV